MKKVIVLSFCCLFALWPARAAIAQQAQTPPEPLTALRVFLDCQDARCDEEYMRAEIAFVDFVRTREDADVHVLITSEHTGVGGHTYTLKFIGRETFKGLDDELIYSSPQTDSEELTRRGLVRTLKLGLARYAARTKIASDLNLVHRPQGGGKPAAESRSVARDRWNYWAFRTELSVDMDGEKSETSRSVFGSFSANRTTEAWKINLSAYNDYELAKYEYEGEEGGFEFTRRSFSIDGLVVKSLTDHWSAGGLLSVSASTHTNQDLAFRVAPAIEYNFYPYSESTRRQFIVLYTVGPNYYDYKEETLFGRVTEWAASHTFKTAFDMKQPWGSMSIDADFSQYLHDLSKRRISFSAETDVRLFKGFSFNIDVNTSRIHDQLYLPKGAASIEEVLTRRRQLATSYQYSVSVGFSYAFGSIFNNVVNTRLSNLGSHSDEW
jgi:hypothetical protein